MPIVVFIYACISEYILINNTAHNNIRYFPLQSTDIGTDKVVIEEKLRQQQRESEEDQKWLVEEETNLVIFFFLVTK